MARKKLNTKLALIGSIIIILLGVCVIGLFMYLSQDADKYIEDGDALFAKAMSEEDPEVKTEIFKQAERCYHKARSLRKTDEGKVEMLFKLIDVHKQTGHWNFIRGCWSGIIKLDPENVKVRYGQLKDRYIMASEGISTFWNDVEQEARELLEVAENKGILGDDTSKWESFESSDKTAEGKTLGVYLRFVKGRANLGIGILGAVTNAQEYIDKAIEDLQEVHKSNPNDVDAAWYLSQAIQAKGDMLASKGDSSWMEGKAEEIEGILEETTKAASDNSRSFVNLLNYKFVKVISQPSIDIEEQMDLFAPQYLSLVEKFPSDPEVLAALGNLYQSGGYKYLDKAIEVSEKAMMLEESNVAYAYRAAYLNYIKYSIFDEESVLTKALEISNNALSLPQAQEIEGPELLARRRNRLSLNSFIANACIGYLLDNPSLSESEKRPFIDNAEKAVEEIKQIYGGGNEADVVKWNGLLELVNGKTNSAVRKLYSSYDELKAAGRRDMYLSYVLGRHFSNSQELGAAAEFYVSSISLNDRSAPDKIDDVKPESLLEYADILLRLGVYDGAMNFANYFERKYWSNDRSKMLKVMALTGLNQMDEAEQILSDISSSSDPNIIKLKLQIDKGKAYQLLRSISRKQNTQRDILQGTGGEQDENVSTLSLEELENQLMKLHDSIVQLNNELVEVDPNYADTAYIVQICREYAARGQKEKAKGIISEMLAHLPDNFDLQVFNRVFSEEDPMNISQEKMQQIQNEVIANIDDADKRAFNLGALALKNGDTQTAFEEYSKVLKEYIGDQGKTSGDSKKEMSDLERYAVDYLFSLSNDSNDWKLSQKLVDLARVNDIDGCGGKYFASRLNYDKGKYEDAMVQMESCLKQRPVFSAGYMQMSNISEALGHEEAAIESARKATRWNPTNAQLAKSFAIKLYRRNQQLGGNVSNEQILEVRQALDRAIKLNQNDYQLLSFYAEYISDNQPYNALSIRQTLQKYVPSMQNALLLGGLATRMAIDEKDSGKKEVLFGIAEAAFEDARKIDPEDKSMLYSYAEYYRARGQEDKAKELLEQSTDERMLASHYASMGEYVKARDIMEKLYSQNQEDASILQSLVVLAQKMVDTDRAKKYSEQLISLEDNIDNRLVQIQVYLNIGLIDEAEKKLAGFNDKYSNDPRSHILSSFLMLRKGKFEDALKEINLSLEADQGSVLAWRLRGEINHAIGNYSQAISDYKQSRLIQDDPAIRIGLAKSYLRAGRVEEGITELKNAVEQPQVAIEAIGLLEDVYRRYNQRQALESLYENSIEKYPDYSELVYRAGDFYGSIGNYTKAEEIFKRLLDKMQEQGPAYKQVLDGYLQSLILQKKYDVLFAEGSKHVNNEYSPFVFVRMAQAKAELGDRITSIDYCKKALGKMEGIEDSIRGLLITMINFLGADNTIGLFEEFLESNANSLGGNLAMFEMMQLKGDYNKGLNYIDKCIEITGSGSDKVIGYTVKKSEILALAYQRTSDKKYLLEAIKVYESLLSEMPNNVSIMNNLAYMLAENDERVEEALEYARKVCDAYPNNASFNDTLGYIQYKLGKYGEADETIQSVIQKYESQKTPVPTETYMHLGMTKQALGQKEQAANVYKQALESINPKASDYTSKSEMIKSLLEQVE